MEEICQCFYAHVRCMTTQEEAIYVTGFRVHPLNLRPIRGMPPSFRKYFKEKNLQKLQYPSL